jgi:hypothetical protein
LPPPRSRPNAPSNCSVRWALRSRRLFEVATNEHLVYRSPQSGAITFAPATALLQDGKSATTAAFSEPGEYVIQGVVDDGSLLAGTYCCWISREVRVTVK